MKDPKKCCCPKCEGRMRYNPICKHGDCPCHAPTIQESPDLPTNPTQISTKLVGESPTQGGGEWDREYFDTREDEDTMVVNVGKLRRYFASQASEWLNICSNARKEEAAHTRAEIAEKVRGMKIRQPDNSNRHYKKGEIIDCGFNAGLDAVLKELDKIE